ncbi:protein-glutamate methylesterase/protein glutamine deamidase [Gammaproteobacteria bacterium]
MRGLLCLETISKRCSISCQPISMTIKVLVVDDSALIRSVLTEIINREHDMTVVGTAADPLQAREKIKTLEPDVLTLDVEMPRMDGLNFLERLMRLRPMPVVMVSSLTERDSEVTFRALELGAVDVVSKPRMDIRRGMEDYSLEITDKIRAAAIARFRPHLLRTTPKAATAPPTTVATSEPVTTGHSRPMWYSSERIIVIGASTGGTEAIKDVLLGMPPDAPAILITQHMPPGFTRSFAERLDRLCRIRVQEAVNGERALPGHAYIAPGDSHLVVKRSGADYVLGVNQDPPVNRHRPSVDVLFRAAASTVGRNAIGVILTGMGKDGAAGMFELKQSGAYTLGQDEATCIVYGMPREAFMMGAVDEQAPLSEISGKILSYLTRSGGRQLRI